MRIVTESMAGVPSAALGIWVENGSRYETRAQAGISHYLEHLFFKGTPTRDAAQIAEAFDSIGGFFNAFTGKECTCYYAKVLGEHLPLAQEVLGDLFRNSLFDDEEIERERSVIVQEILQGEDNPDDVVHEQFNLQYWPDHPLSFPVSGSVATVESFQRDDFMAFIAERYRPDRLLIAAAGNVAHDQVVAWVREAFGDLQGATEPVEQTAPEPKRGFRQIEKPLEQVHMCIGAPGIRQDDEHRYPAYLLNTALGGGMSSRLFQEIREKRGRAYSVYSFLSAFRDGGYLGVYAGTSAEWAPEVIEVAIDQIRQIARDGLRPEELERVKNQLKGNMLLGLETTDSRMHRIARNQLYFGKEIPPAEVAEKIDATTNDDILAVAKRIARPEAMAATLVGDFKEQQLSERLLG